MNAHSRRVFRRALSASTGIAPGLVVTRGTTSAKVEQVAPNGRPSVLVKRKDNRRVVWPMRDLQSLGL